MRCGLYARQSLDRSGEGLAIERQLADCRKLAEARGWTVVDKYPDNDASATTGRPRPHYERMLDDIRAGRIQAIVAYAHDRLARRVSDVETLLELVKSSGLEVATVTSGGLDLSSPGGRAMASIFASISRMETEQKAARQKRANRQRAEAGATRWVRRPFGYRLDLRTDAGSEIDVGEASEIRAAAEAILDGATLAAIVRDLNSRDVPTSTGAAWTVSTLRRVMLNPRLSGTVTYRGKAASVGYPAILGVDQHRAVTSRLTDTSRRTSMTTSHKWLLSGSAICGRCGGRMFAAPMGPKGNRWMAYRCLDGKGHVCRRLDLVDGVVVAAVVARMSREDVVDLLAAPGPDLAALHAEAHQLRGNLDDLSQLLGEKVLTIAGVRKESARLQGRLAAVEAQLDAAAGRSPLGPLIGAQDVRAVWDGLPLRKRRAVIDALMVVTVMPAGKGRTFTDDQVRIGWKG